MLSVHKLDAYRVSVEFLELALELGKTLSGDDADQLTRAAKSIMRNIAEGAGRWGRADKAKHYSIARGEAMECVSCIDLMRVEGAIDSERHVHATELLRRLVSMITGLIKNPM
jgi:four helix bundle protein